MARRKNRDAFHPPLCLPRRGKSCPNLRRLKWVSWMNSKLIALLDNPFMKFHHRPMKRQVPYIFSRQPETPALAEAASIGHQSGRPQPPRHTHVPVSPRSRQPPQQPLAAIHDKFPIPNDPPPIG